LGGLRTAIRRAKALAGIDEDTKIAVENLPGSSFRDMLRPKPSSQPAAASLPDALGALAIRSLVGVVDQTQRSLTGVNVLWLGETRY
ncbi:signal peptide peptidase SppA, partial [Mycobacterium sp. ITM-2017-0098]